MNTNTNTLRNASDHQSLSRLTAAACHLAALPITDPREIEKLRSLAAQLNSLAPMFAPRIGSKVALVAETVLAICRAADQAMVWNPDITTGLLMQWRHELRRLSREIRTGLPNC